MVQKVYGFTPREKKGRKKTSIGRGNVSRSTMNKGKKRGLKLYRGQGR